MAVLRASLSAHGYRPVARRDAAQPLSRRSGRRARPCSANGATISACSARRRRREPWGWQLFGHHLVLNCFVLGRADGADAGVLGRGAGLRRPRVRSRAPVLFQDEERAGLTLMRSLSPRQQRAAPSSRTMMGGDLPEGRRHFADNLHLGGAFQDNRIMPYEGLTGDELTAAQRRRPDRPGREVYRAAAGRAAHGAHGRDRAAPRRHAFLLDRRLRRGKPVLLPRPEPGGVHRVRPPRRRVPDQRGAGEIPRPHHRADAERQRLRHRSAAAALPESAAPPRHD